jgi:hypothetical protein
MITRRRYPLIVLSTFLFSAVCVLGALPNTTAPIPPTPQRPLPRITIKGGQPIKVNGNDVTNGGTIVTGSTIEVPDQVSAVIDLGDAGIVELSPNTRIQLDYDENGNVRTKLFAGCAASKKRNNVLQGEMEIYTDQADEKTNKKRRSMAFCFVNGQLVGAAGAAAVSGSTIGITGGIVAGGIVGIIVGARGNNPSPTTP